MQCFTSTLQQFKDQQDQVDPSGVNWSRTFGAEQPKGLLKRCHTSKLPGPWSKWPWWCVLASLPWFKGEAFCLTSCLCCPASCCSPGCTETTQGTSSNFWQNKLSPLINSRAILVLPFARFFPRSVCAQCDVPQHPQQLQNILLPSNYTRTAWRLFVFLGPLVCNIFIWASRMLHGMSSKFTRIHWFTRKLRPAKWASRLATSSTSKSLMNLPRCHTVLSGS